ncbi:MAG TPA: hypothetical protein VN963_04225 [bacterium]|nr:hypothetical protein [bacterium]
MKTILTGLIWFTLGSALPVWAQTAPVTNEGSPVNSNSSVTTTPVPNDGSRMGSSAGVTTDPPESGHWFMQLNGDLNSPTGNLANEVNQGWGGEISVGYHLTRSTEIAIETGFDTYSEKDTAFNGSWNMTPLVFKGIYIIGHEFVRPYVFLAAGMAFNSRIADFGAYTGSNNEADFLGEAGFGLSFSMGEGSSVFLQTKMEVDTTSAGYASDQPTILIPLNAGIKFALN